MKTTKLFSARSLCTVAAMLLLAFSTACTSKKSSTLTTSESEDPYANGVTDGSVVNPYDSSSTSSTDLSLPGNLFDTTTTGTEQVGAQAAQNQTTTTISQNQNNCLTSNQGLYGSNPYCAQQSNGWGADEWLDFAADSFGEMNYCYQAVNKRGKELLRGFDQLPAGVGIVTIFEQSGMAMVRCFSQVLERHMTVVKWNQEQQQLQQKKQQQMQMMMMMMSMFSNEEKK